MTMAQILKACTLHESTSSILGPHMVGFLSVLAISGSVALISLVGKAKLRQAIEGGEPNTHTQEGNEEEENEHTHTHSKSLHEETSELTRTHLKRKKVRFAPDVIDPPCNGQQYRARFEVSQGPEMHARLPHSRVSQVPEMHARLRHPKSTAIPANRMALYKGQRQSRLQHSLLC